MVIAFTWHIQIRTEPSMETTVRLDHRQQQTLSPRLQHAVRLLQMSSLDFVRELHDVVGRNPFLEDEAESEDGDVAVAAGGTDAPTPAMAEPGLSTSVETVPDVAPEVEHDGSA